MHDRISPPHPENPTPEDLEALDQDIRDTCDDLGGPDDDEDPLQGL